MTAISAAAAAKVLAKRTRLMLERTIGRALVAAEQQSDKGIAAPSRLEAESAYMRGYTEAARLIARYIIEHDITDATPVITLLTEAATSTRDYGARLLQEGFPSEGHRHRRISCSMFTVRDWANGY